MSFKSLFWNEIHSWITMETVTLGNHDIRKCRPSNFQVNPFARHKNPTPHFLTDLTNACVVLYLFFLSFQMNNGMIQKVWCSSYLVPNIPKYILSPGIVFWYKSLNEVHYFLSGGWPLLPGNYWQEKGIKLQAAVGQFQVAHQEEFL